MEKEFPLSFPLVDFLYQHKNVHENLKIFLENSRIL